MYEKVGLHFPITRAVLIQYFELHKESKDKISYRKIAENIVSKFDDEIEEENEEIE